jgi:hypothetical protein
MSENLPSGCGSGQSGSGIGYATQWPKAASMCLKPSLGFHAARRRGVAHFASQPRRGTRRTKLRLAHLILPPLLSAVLDAPAAVHYVDVNSTNAVSPYSDWSTAAVRIQDAVDAALSGDEIIVTNGVYRSGGRLVSGDQSLMTNRVVVNKPVVAPMRAPSSIACYQGTRRKKEAAGLVRVCSGAVCWTATRLGRWVVGRWAAHWKTAC